MTIAPVVEGRAPIRLPAPHFLAGFRRRVGVGLLTGRAHPRSRYVATSAGTTGLHIRAADWWTAINVGLNEIDLRVDTPGVVHYRVRYWRWAGYALGLCGGMGIIGVGLLLLADARDYIGRHSAEMIPGLSVDQNLMLAWGMVLFWGFIWPWLLIQMHRRPLRHLVERLIGEVDAAGSPATPAT